MQSIIRFLEEKECLRVIALLSPDAHFDPCKLSLYERFAFLCDMLPMMPQNRVAARFLALLSEDIGCEIAVGALQNAENQKLIWRAIACSGTLADPLASLDFTYSSVGYAPSENAIDLYSFVVNSDKTELEEAINAIVFSDCDAVFADLSHFVYSRPDVYHCTQTYNKLISGEKTAAKEISALICWCLCRVLMKREMGVLLKVDDSTEEAEKLIELLRQRKLFTTVELCVPTDNEELVKRVAKICFDTEEISLFLRLLSFDGDGDLDTCTNKALNILPAHRIRIKKN